MKSFKSIKGVQAFIQEQEIKMVDFKVVDRKGRWNHVTIPPEGLNEEVMTEGIGFDGSSYGFLTVEKSDMVLIPDLTTGFIDPFREMRTLVFIADIYRLEGDERVRFEDDPRYVAKKGEAYLVEQGIGDQVLFGPEFEFYVLDHISYQIKNHHMEVKIDAGQAEWNTEKSDENNPGHQVGKNGGYHVDAPFDSSYDFRNETVDLLGAYGVPVKYHHSENGGPGQVEIEVEFASLLEMADRTQKLKYILRNNGVKNRRTITFMPKPFSDECGNGLHIHMQLFNQGKPLFYHKGGYSDLSSTALYAIGGILKHAPALMAFTNPSTNSYKRLVPGFEAPVSICYGTANRSAVIRIPGYATNPKSKRFELRSPDGTANPYFAYTAMLLAAVDGIENRIDPEKEGYGPYDVNVYELKEEERERVKSLPRDLLEACDALERDHQFLLKGDVFTKNLIENQIKGLREEHHQIHKLPHPEEFRRYYNL